MAGSREDGQCPGCLRFAQGLPGREPRLAGFHERVNAGLQDHLTEHITELRPPTDSKPQNPEP